MPLKDYRFIDKDFTGMLVNVNAITELKDVYQEAKQILGIYPIFEPLHKYSSGKEEDMKQRMKEVREGSVAKFKSARITNNMVIRFICLFYDPKSPLNTGINDFNERKIVAAQMSKFEILNDGEFYSVFQDIMNGKNKTVNHMIIYFLRFFNNHIYTTLRITMDKYYNEILPRGDMKEIQETSKFITQLERDFLMQKKDENEAFLKPTLFAIVNKELVEIENLRPERVLAKMMEE